MDENQADVISALKFEFTNRTDSIKRIKGFITNEVLDTNLLWVSGEKGVGVSRLLAEISQNLDTSKYIIAFSSIDECGGGKQALNRMLSELSKQSGYSLRRTFARLVRSDSFTDPAISLVGTFTDPAIGAVVSAVYSIGKNISIEKGEQISVHEVLGNYICEILDRTDKDILLVFDHFHKGEPEYIDITHALLKRLHRECRVRFIISAPEEQLANRLDIREMLMDSLGVLPYRIKEFRKNQQGCFAQALQYAFPGIESSSVTLNRIFAICDGNIGILKEGLRRFIAQQSDKNGFSAEKFCEYLETESSSPVVFSDLIHVMITACLRAYAEPIKKEVLRGVVEYIFSKEYHVPKIATVTFEEKLLQLRNLGIVALVDSSVSLLVWSFEEVGANVNLAIYDHYRALIEFDKHYEGVTAKDRILLVRLALKANTSEAFKLGWSQVAWLHSNEAVYEACDCATLLLSHNQSVVCLNGKDAIDLSYSLYNLGRYKDAEVLLNSIDLKEVGAHSFEEKYRILFLRGKCKNLRGDLVFSAKDFEEAMQYTSTPDEEISTRTMLQLVFMEQPGAQQAAKDLLDKTLDSIADKKSFSLVECMAVRTLVDFYASEKYNAVLISALNQANQYGDSFVSASLEVALGLQYLRAGKIGDAKEMYSSALSRLEMVRPHEQSYVYNNLGTCEMLLGNYADALYFFLDGTFINKSPYMRTVLKANRGVCYALMGRRDDAVGICEELFTSHLRDDNRLILTRVCMTICFIIVQCSLSKETPSLYGEMFNQCIALARQNTEKLQQNRRLNSYDEKRAAASSYSQHEIKDSQTYHDSPFQPWVATLHHD